MSVARCVSGLLDRLDEDAHGVLVRSQVGCEATLVADCGGQSALVQQRLERVVGLGAPSQRFSVRRRADRHHHELLEVDAVVCMHATVDDVHHRDGQHVGVRATDVPVQRDLELGRRRLRDRERHPEERVGAQARLRVGRVEVDQRRVDTALVERVHVEEHVADLAVHVAHRRRHALAAEPGAPVAQLDRFVLAGRGTRRDDGAAPGAGDEQHLDLDRRVATRIEDLAPDDVLDLAHPRTPRWSARPGLAVTQCC